MPANAIGAINATSNAGERLLVRLMGWRENHGLSTWIIIAMHPPAENTSKLACNHAGNELRPLSNRFYKIPDGMMTPTIYKISPRTLWLEAEGKGVFEGAPIDLADGFIHFSTSGQAIETADKHFRGQDDLLLIAIDTAKLGSALKFEPSRGGALFPHLYARLSMEAVIWVKPLPMKADGSHDFPEMAS